MLEDIIKMDEQYYMNTFGKRLPVAFDRGEGCCLFDIDGEKYYDFSGGIAVNALGYNNDALTGTICSQAKKVIHTSNYYYIESQAKLAKELCENSCADKVFFGNSGAEANEAAIKLARKYFYDKGMKNKYEIITMKNSFHGRTLATLAATGQDKFHTPYEPLTEKFTYSDINDIEALKSIINENTAAIMLELIQGEGGVNPLDYNFVGEIRKLCDEKEIILIVDEIQTGIGRTGTLFLYEQYNIEPDIFTLAKGLGGGVPIGAVLAKDKFCAFKPGDHGSTFGGNPLACSAGLCVIDQLLNNGILKNAKEMGYYLKYELTQLKKSYNIINEIKGVGLMLGISLKEPAAAEIRKKLFDNKMLVCTAGDSVLRLLPPLVITKEDIDIFITSLKEVLKQWSI